MINTHHAVVITRVMGSLPRSTGSPSGTRAETVELRIPRLRKCRASCCRAAYARFGLNDRQIELIAEAPPKRHYSLQSRRGNRLFDLALGPVVLALCGASSPDDQKLIDRLSSAPDSFLESWLAAKGLPWAVDLIREYVP
ncbi:hypothetical protein [Magnetospirillum molischianum]|uniref:Uncharacterized protein n=1 Tax=Magnetospirillum molischianum DSM 120 TaxID=1150626 RepID=H8FXT7_MAGML|nr:hypothetical protein [Magnetospirillum molischianum]CCG43175.1 hypothetical protein PHAMO_580081 [Magnetospirillum molischianum DSM 120]